VRRRTFHFNRARRAAGGRAAGTSQAATSLPCDLYAAAGTPCVAAHSTVRALYAAYNGPLYQVKRASDNAALNIGTLTAGGYGNAAAQNSFCAGTSCIITEIYVTPGVGYRDDATTGVATGAQPQGAYMVASGTHVNQQWSLS
jgi:hypothetical protein